MKDNDLRAKIINECIKSLQTEGLRFSVDTLAKRLRISKKTIYVYFSTKEELASAVYDAFYIRCQSEIEAADEKTQEKKAIAYFKIYYSSFNMACDDIFNKYALNDSIINRAKQLHNDLWQIIVKRLKIKDEDICKIIINGTFSELRKQNSYCDEAIKKVGAILCL